MGGCGVNEDTLQWMDRIQNSGPEDTPIDSSETESSTSSPPSPSKFKKIKKSKKQKYMDKSKIFEEDLQYPHIKYTKEANWKDSSLPVDKSDSDDWHRESHERAKRAARSKEENRNTCSLYIQTDPLIWRHVREGIADVNIFYIFQFFFIRIALRDKMDNFLPFRFIFGLFPA